MTELEVGFGRSCVLFKLAQIYPERNFIGVELEESKVNRYDWIARRYKNVKLIAGNITQIITMIEAQSIARVHIYFPTPVPNLRYIDADFVYELYRILEISGIIKIATDDLDYFRLIEELFFNSIWARMPWNHLEYERESRSLVGTGCEEQYSSKYYLECRKRI